MTQVQECIVVNNNDELLSVLEESSSSILITDTFKEDFLDKTQLPLSETEQMGFALGSHGSTMLFGGIIYAVMSLFSKQDKQRKKIDRKCEVILFKNMVKKFCCGYAY